MCNGTGGQSGYYCPPDPNDAKGGDAAFACMDWTFGSTAMLRAEASFKSRTGEDTYLGVGTWGSAEGLGACYRMKVDGVDKDIIGQSLNTGHDVAGNQFDLQIGAGGAGAFNTCAGGPGSMFPGSREPWGCQYGGVDSREDCAKLPPYPQDDQAMKKAGDSLVKLCEYSFDKKVRVSGAPLGNKCGFNPTILDAARVKCPKELVELTQIQRTDDPANYKAPSAPGFPNLDKKHSCKSQTPGSGVAYCLTRMMDCRKPSGGFKDNVKTGLMVPGKKLVQICAVDGYTRFNVACGCKGCYC